MRTIFKCALVAGSLMLMDSASSFAQSKKEIADLKNFPKGFSPQEVGRRVAEHFVATPHANFGRTTPPKIITYPETCTWYGALTFAKVSGDKQLTQQLVQRSAENQRKLFGVSGHEVGNRLVEPAFDELHVIRDLGQSTAEREGAGSQEVPLPILLQSFERVEAVEA